MNDCLGWDTVSTFVKSFKREKVNLTNVGTAIQERRGYRSTTYGGGQRWVMECQQCGSVAGVMTGLLTTIGLKNIFNCYGSNRISR